MGGHGLYSKLISCSVSLQFASRTARPHPMSLLYLYRNKAAYQAVVLAGFFGRGFKRATSGTALTFRSLTLIAVAGFMNVAGAKRHIASCSVAQPNITRRRKPVAFEVCVDSVASGLAAEAGGAQRVELCDNLVEGGTTPSIGTVRTLRRNIRIPIHVLIRPRGGDFLYSELEMQVMLADIAAMKAEGVDGVVIGALQSDGNIDRSQTEKLIACARPLSVTFHRAFDMACDVEAALEVCIELGIDRILTSGAQPTAASRSAKKTLRTLVSKCEGKCNIIAAAGITCSNVSDIVRETGVREVHASAGRVTRNSDMTYRPAQLIFMGAEKQNTPETEFTNKYVTADNVKAYVDLLKDL